MMGITDVVIQPPRFFVNATDIRQIWNSPILGGYQRILKHGLDENETTLAVNAFVELVDRLGSMPEQLFLYTGHGSFDFSTFLEATGLDEDKVELLPSADHYALVALKECANIPNSAFLLTESLENPSSSIASILGTISITGYNGSKAGVQCDEIQLYNGVRSQVMRYVKGEFDPRVEPAIIDALRKALPKEVRKEIFTNVAELKMLKKAIPNANIDMASQIGYIGSVTSVVAYFKSLDKLTQAMLIVSDEHHTATLELLASGSVNVYEASMSQQMNLSQYMALRNASKGNESMSQGAYISSSTYFNQRDARYRLKSVICRNCKAIQFPPRLLCKKCRGKTEPHVPLSRHASLYSFTKIMKGAAPTEFDIQQSVEGEYCVGIVEFQDGVRVIAQLSDVNYDDLKIGMPMKMSFRKIYRQHDEDRYGYKFIPEKP